MVATAQKDEPMPKPKKNPNKQVFPLWLDNEDMDKLRAVAKGLRLRRTQLIRQMLSEFLDVYAQRASAKSNPPTP